jgi:hypothetical protein
LFEFRSLFRLAHWSFPFGITQTKIPAEFPHHFHYNAMKMRLLWAPQWNAFDWVLSVEGDYMGVYASFFDTSEPDDIFHDSLFIINEEFWW